MRTFWIAQWKTGLQRLKIFETKEGAEYYRDNCSVNGSVEIIKVEEKKKMADFEIAFGGYSTSDIVDELTAAAKEKEEKKVAKFEMAFGGYSTSDLEEEYKEFTTTEEEPSLFQYPDEWAKAMREGRKFKHEDSEYFYDESFANPFRISSERYEISDAINASWKHYDKVTETMEPKWYDKDLGGGVWCKVWDNKKEHYDITKIVSVVLTGIYPYKSGNNSWIHAEPVSKELAKMLDEEVK